MSHPYFQFLPAEIQSSIAALRDLDDPAARATALDQLTERILKASEAKTTSLQMDLDRIETAFERRYDLIETKLIADNQSRTSDIYQMVSDVRNAQLAAHPQITEALAGVNTIQNWVGRLEAAFVAGRDYAASERARLEVAIVAIDARVTVVEAILELKPKADG